MPLAGVAARPSSATSTASRAIRRYVVYLPPDTRTSPDGSRSTLCSRLTRTESPPRMPDERAQPGIRADSVVTGQPDIEDVVHHPEDLVDVGVARRHAVR